MALVFANDEAGYNNNNNNNNNNNSNSNNNNINNNNNNNNNNNDNNANYQILFTINSLEKKKKLFIQNTIYNSSVDLKST